MPATKKPHVLDVVSDGMKEKYPGDPMRDPDANRMLILYMYLARLFDCAEGRCVDKSCEGVMTHVDYLAKKMNL